MPNFTDRWSNVSALDNVDLLEFSPLKPRELVKHFPLLKAADFEQLHLASEDIALGRWADGAILYQEGSYVDQAFMIKSGNVKLMTNVQTPPARLNAGALTFQTFWSLDESSGVMKMRLGRGDMFGEIGVVNGWPQPFAAVTEGECELLHLRMPALRRLRNKIKSLDELLGKEYARQVVLGVLKQHPLFAGVPEAALAELAPQCEFKNFDPGEIIAHEQTEAEDIYLLRAGFARISRVLVEEPLTLNYLEPGEVFGANEFVQMRGNRFAHTLASYEYSDVLRIPHAALREIAHMDFRINTRLHECARAFNAKCLFETPESAHAAPTLFFETPKPETKILSDPARLALLENLVAQGLMQGQDTMLIDLARCTHCDECVTACAETHEGLPRFVREGKHMENWLVTESCRHCRDPLCLIGCPTGAIARRGANALVKIDETLCIGCKACAVHCPFDAIMMHDTGELWNVLEAPQPNLVGKARLVASKCDACDGKSHGPACVKACPVGCLVRVENVKGFFGEGKAVAIKK